MDYSRYTESNRRAWNEVTPMHQEAKQEKFFKAFKTPGYVSLDRLITERIRKIGLKEKRVAQLGCNDGRETLSLKNLEAETATGFDISDAAIAEAIRLSETSGVKCEFVQSDIYAIPEKYNGAFDFIYISIGVFGWMPDLAGFFRVASRLLVPGGEILIYEQHPVAEIFDAENRVEPLKIVNRYFNDEPMADDAGFDYWGGKSYRGEVSYWFFHSMGTIITRLIESGIQIKSLQEYPHDISSMWEHIEKTGKMLPLSYILHGQKL